MIKIISFQIQIFKFITLEEYPKKNFDDSFSLFIKFFFVLVFMIVFLNFFSVIIIFNYERIRGRFQLVSEASAEITAENSKITTKNWYNSLNKNEKFNHDY